MRTKHNAQELDVVKLLVDLPEHGLKKGQEGTVLVVFDGPPKHYLVEFADEEGDEIATVALRPEQIEVIWSFADHRPEIDQIDEGSSDLNAKTYFEKGMIYLNNGLLDAAGEEFRRCFEINPSYAGSLLNAAKPLAAKGRWDLTAEICKLVLSLQPDRQTARDNLAVSYLNLGVEQSRKKQYKEALESYYQVLKIAKASEGILQKAQSNVCTLYNNLAIELTLKHRFEEAAHYFGAALALSPTKVWRNWVLFLVTWSTFRKINQPTRSEEEFKELNRLAIETGIEPSELYNARGAVLADHGKLNEAINAFSEALRLNPQNDTAGKNLVQVQEWLKKGKAEKPGGEIPFPFDVQNEPSMVSLETVA